MEKIQKGTSNPSLTQTRDRFQFGHNLADSQSVVWDLIKALPYHRTPDLLMHSRGHPEMTMSSSDNLHYRLRRDHGRGDGWIAGVYLEKGTR
jgi:hypothetical protein